MTFPPQITEIGGLAAPGSGSVPPFRTQFPTIGKLSGDPGVAMQPPRESALRPGNVHSADGWDGVLKPVAVSYQGKVSRIYFRADAAFAMPEVYGLPGGGADQLRDPVPANQVLRSRIAYLLKRPVGDRRTRCAASMPISLSGGKLNKHMPGDRQSRAAPRVSFIRARRLHRHQPERKVKARSSGHSFPAGHSPPTPFGSSFIRWPTISAISCARWPRADQGLVSDVPRGEAHQDRYLGGEPR